MKKKIILFAVLFAIVILLGSLKKDNRYELTENKISKSLKSVEILEIETIPFDTEEIEDITLKKGERTVIRNGEDGKSEILYKVVFFDNKEEERIPISEKIIKNPVDEIIHVNSL